MAQDIPNISINLGSKKRRSFANTFFAWAITIGRGIIVLTELIALSALFYRFIIDRQIIDLHDQIKTAETLVKLQEKQENEYRDIQERLKNIKDINDATNNKIQLLNSILQNIQKNQILATKFNLNENSIIFGGTTPSVFTLADFINNLKSQPDISSINVGKVNSLPRGVDFEILVNTL